MHDLGPHLNLRIRITVHEDGFLVAAEGNSELGELSDPMLRVDRNQLCRQAIIDSHEDITHRLTKHHAVGEPLWEPDRKRKRILARDIDWPLHHAWLERPFSNRKR